MDKKIRKITSGVVFACALFTFVFIAYNVINSIETGIPLTFDTVIRQAVIGLRNDVMNPLAIIITYLGNSSTIIWICIALLILPKTRIKYGLPLAVTASCSATLQTIIKISIQRPRPPVENFLISQGGFSFPSGHSCTGLVFYGLFAYLILYTGVDKAVYKVVGICFVVLPLLIGISRIYVGVHYPTDVLAGWSLGITFIMVAVYIINWVKKPMSDGSIVGEGR